LLSPDKDSVKKNTAKFGEESMRKQVEESFEEVWD
jgi:hypothetical protein